MAEEEDQFEWEQEEEQEDSSLRPVASSMVAEIGYEKETGELAVVFNNGHENQYPITEDMWKELLDAPSTGQWLWENVLR